MILRELLRMETYAGKTLDEILALLNADAEGGSVTIQTIGREADAVDMADALATESEIEQFAIRSNNGAHL